MPAPPDGSHPAARPAPRAAARTAKARAAEIVLVCRKCARRAGLSPKAARRLAEEAAKEAAKQAATEAAEQADKLAAPVAAENAAAPGAKARKRKLAKAKIVETGCLGPCPKRLVAVATATGLAAGRVALLDPQADPPPALPDFGPSDFGPNAAVPAPAEAGTRGGAPDPARTRAPIPT